MFKKIVGTIRTRYVIALLNLALIFINAKALGAEGMGMVGIILASINIAIIVNGIFSGNTIVYFMGRYPARSVVFPAWLWTVPGSALACVPMFAAGLLPVCYGWDIGLLAVLSSLVVVNTRILLGQDRIKDFNITFIIQGGGLFFALLYFYYVAKEPTVRSYLWAMYTTNGAALLVSSFLVYPVIKKKTTASAPPPSRIKLWKEMLRYGLWAGTDNLAEVLTTRLNYFLVQKMLGLWSVGLLDAGTKVSESVWHISRSVSLITYGSVAKTQDAAEQKHLTLRLFKLTFCALAAVMAAILCLPEKIYTHYLFSPDFIGVKNVVVGLSVGIVALGSNNVLSHFFIGSGRIRYSAYCSLIGLVVLLIAGQWLIPAYGITGAAVSASVAFAAMLLFSLTAFRRVTGATLPEFLPNGEDVRLVIGRLRHRFFCD